MNEGKGTSHATSEMTKDTGGESVVELARGNSRRKLSPRPRQEVADALREGVGGTVETPDEEEEFFLFDKMVRQTMKPTLTPLFAVSWCWPKVSEESVPQRDAETDHCQWDIGPTTITELRGDPRLRRGNRLIALIITEGRRFLLPLIPERREDDDSPESGVYWQVPTRPYEVQLSQSPRAQLVIGTLQHVEEVNDMVRRFAESGSQHDDNVSLTTGEPIAESEGTLHSPLGTFSFSSIPCRCLWLYRIPNCVVVSLPCEERLVFINTGPGVECKSIAPRVLANVLSCVSSFSFPRHVVPLDVNEIFDRPFVVVGTLLHGVLVVHVEDCGICTGIVHHIPLTGLVSSIFPVTRLASVFPARRNRGEEISETSGAYWLKSGLFSQCLDGVIICSSPYEDRAVVVKCASATNGGCGYELAPPKRFFCGISSATYTYSSVGTVVGTLDGKVMSVLASTELTEDGSGSKSYKEFRRCRHSAAYDATCPAFVCTVLARNMTSGALTFICEGGPVLQKTSHTKYQRSFVRHWLCHSTTLNEVVLLDRNLQSYAVHSTVPLGPPESDHFDEEAPDDLRRETDQNTDNNREREEGSDTANVHLENGNRPHQPLENIISGLSWLLVEDGFLQVIVAHHKNWLSTITWKT
ncbi:hypothetical protein, conserved [Trypanosoma brucei gambiense DAL972]|uniref:Uncharacterized protein n=1 Tax=Trypanosoma brucei gambiense (strain MHOM/CI/86/DAL972) TaxID=679716 RepID=C9ZUJ7_TRYB9|nr:hypothetical protein, conserved [Trypanosoma brucei gambiense DAL972]CBH13085.1 hypothetical protein, conserved [Trypanosoma brucei gambiense DAL972]|eukprot:XP_011775362.1 hypothetical protein, conserved [Trypanosoma brucei gambiense DAL972]